MACGGQWANQLTVHDARIELAQSKYRLVGSRFGLLVVSRVNALTQLFARLEVRHLLARNLHFFTGLGIAAYARRPLGQGEAPESTDLDALTGGQGLGHGIEYRLDGVIGITRRQLRVTASKYRYQFRLCHAN